MIHKARLKLWASIINTVIVLFFCIPLFYFDISNTTKKLGIIIIFFLYNLLFLIRNKNRCIGMIIMKTQYPNSNSFLAHFIHNIFYTLSFATLLIWIYFPFDLFLINMLCIQLPFIKFTGTTLHGYILQKI